jgi:hypothetical protein
MPRPFPEAKRQEWKRLVEQWEESDQKISIVRWCAQQNINYNNFLYWRERFRLNSTRTVDRACFQELAQPTVPKGIVLECNQFRIRLAENFDAVILRKCLQVLKEVAC